MVGDSGVVGLGSGCCGGSCCGCCYWRSDNCRCCGRTSDDRGCSCCARRSSCGGGCCCDWTNNWSDNWSCCGCNNVDVDISAEGAETILIGKSVSADASSPVGVDNHVVVDGTDLAAFPSIIVSYGVRISRARADAFVAINQGVRTGLAHFGSRHSEIDITDSGCVDGQESVETQVEVGAHIDVEVHWTGLAVDDG